VDKVSSAGIQALATLPFLRKFTFWIEGRKWLPEQQRCLLLCSQFLPRLKISGMEYKLKIPFEYNDYPMKEFIHNPVILQPRNLGLEQVILSGEVNPHPNCKLPLLQRVCWATPSGDVLGFFNKFQTITELGFFFAEEKVVVQVLKEVGRRLTKLVLHRINSFSLSTILTLCPNLKYVCFSECSSFKDSSDIWPQNMFQSLEEFHLSMGYMIGEEFFFNPFPNFSKQVIHQKYFQVKP
jgi:hypothetical protein